MKKNTKIILIIFIIAILALIIMKRPAFAAINLNINSNTNSVSNETDLDNNTTGNSVNNLQQQYGNELDDSSVAPTGTPTLTDSSAADVYSLNSLPEADLGLSNILSILLIAVGVILILLGIAVFIRLKK